LLAFQLEASIQNAITHEGERKQQKMLVEVYGKNLTCKEGSKAFDHSEIVSINFGVKDFSGYEAMMEIQKLSESWNKVHLEGENKEEKKKEGCLTNVAKVVDCLITFQWGRCRRWPKTKETIEEAAK
jgi:hypothetical protein